MQYFNPCGVEAGEPAFAGLVRERSGVNFNRCYQCLTCTLGCPAFFTMDYLPHQIIRMVQLGAKSEVLRSTAIWRCASCETCVTRCPHGIDITRLMDTLRQMAIQENVPGREPAMSTFHRIFLKGIRQWGRQYELGMLLAFKFRIRDFLGDTGLGIKMLQKRKLSLLPKRIKGYREIEAAFRQAGRG